MLERMVECGYSLQLEDIAAFERRHKIMLPLEYRAFLEKYNGGVPVPSGFHIPEFQGGSFGLIQAFFGLEAKIGTEDLDAVLDDMPVSVPKYMIPIACTGTDDFICFDLSQKQAPIIFWDRMRFWGNQTWDESSIYLIGGSFDLFLNGLFNPNP